MWPFSVEKGKPGPVEGRHRQFKLTTNNSTSHHEHVLYRLKLGYELINRALDFGRNGACKDIHIITTKVYYNNPFSKTSLILFLLICMFLLIDGRLIEF
jgi:hypothetical protein